MIFPSDTFSVTATLAQSKAQRLLGQQGRMESFSRDLPRRLQAPTRVTYGAYPTNGTSDELRRTDKIAGYFLGAPQLDKRIHGQPDLGGSGGPLFESKSNVLHGVLVLIRNIGGFKSAFYHRVYSPAFTRLKNKAQKAYPTNPGRKRR